MGSKNVSSRKTSRSAVRATADTFTKQEAEDRLAAALRGAKIVGHQPRAKPVPTPAQSSYATLPPVDPKRPEGNSVSKRKRRKAD